VDAMPAVSPQFRVDPRFRFEGHAIVSADGMIADAAGMMPEALRNEADWQAFQAALDRAALVVLGRLGHRRHANPGRRRLVLTSAVAALQSDPADALAALWNPAGIALADVLGSLPLRGNVIAVTGGKRVFDAFLGHYDRFLLSESHTCVVPAGIPCFSGGHPRTVLAASGLVPVATENIDAAAGVTSTLWVRPA